MQPNSTPSNDDPAADTPADSDAPTEPSAAEETAITSPIAAMAEDTTPPVTSPIAAMADATPPVTSPIAAMAEADSPVTSPIAAMADADSPVTADTDDAPAVTSPIAAMASDTPATPAAPHTAAAPADATPPPAVTEPAATEPPAAATTPEPTPAPEAAPSTTSASEATPTASDPSDTAPSTPETTTATTPAATPTPTAATPAEPTAPAATSTPAASTPAEPTAPASPSAPAAATAAEPTAPAVPSTPTAATPAEPTAPAVPSTPAPAASAVTPSTADATPASTPAAETAPADSDAPAAAAPSSPSIGDSAPTIGASAPAGATPPPTEAKPPPVAAYGFTSGQVLTGKILSIAEDGEVEVDLDHGRIGVIQKGHLDPKLASSGLLRVGADIEAAVLLRDDPKGRAVLSNTWARKLHAWELIDKAMADNEPFEVTVSEAVKGGLVVDLGIRAFMPASHVDLSHVEDLSTYVGQSVPVLVVEVDKANDKVVLSRRNVLRRAEKGKVAEFIKSLENGQVVSGRVATLTDFGAFVDVQGARGLLHMSEMAWHRIDKPSDIVRPGQDIEVKVIGVKKGGKRISLSLREMSPDPIASVTVGEVVDGVVTRLADFGAFVQIGSGAEGLVHISELSEYRISLPEEVVMPGEELQVKIIGVDAKRRRIDLSVIQAVQY